MLKSSKKQIFSWLERKLFKQEIMYETNRFFLIVLSANLFISSCGELDSSLEMIESVRKEFAPDKRVAIFNVTTVRERGRVVLRGETNLPSAMVTLETKLKEKGFSFTNEVRLLPDSEELDNRCRGVITVSVANIRVKPSNSAEMATQAILGTPVRLYKKMNGDLITMFKHRTDTWGGLITVQFSL